MRAEDLVIIAVLDIHGWDQIRAAERLGTGSATPDRKLKSIGVARGIQTARAMDSVPH